MIEIKPASTLAKPDWIRVRLSHGPRFHDVKRVLREQRLHTVCEEASCPNIGECFGSRQLVEDVADDRPAAAADGELHRHR